MSQQPGGPGFGGSLDDLQVATAETFRAPECEAHGDDCEHVVRCVTCRGYVVRLSVIEARRLLLVRCLSCGGVAAVRIASASLPS